MADDHRILREGVHALIGGERDLDMVGEAENGRTAVQLAKKLSPHGQPDWPFRIFGRLPCSGPHSEIRNRDRR